MIKIYKKGKESIPLINSLSHRIWPEAYGMILTAGQIEYMLDMMYSRAALETLIIHKKQQFIVAFDDDEPVGFAAYGAIVNDANASYRLHKLYILPCLQGKGVGKKIIQFIVDDIYPGGGKLLELNVNKQNPAVGFYQKMGFRITREENTDIGRGYFMDDFVMETELPGIFLP